MRARGLSPCNRTRGLSASRRMNDEERKRPAPGGAGTLTGAGRGVRSTGAGRMV